MSSHVQKAPQPKLREFAPWPHFGEDERAAVDAVLRSGKVNYWTGTHNRSLEEAFARYTGVAHAVAVANGSLALELALAALDIGPGDEVIVTPRSYFASVSSVVLRGATPVFVDVDPDSQNITPATIEPALSPRTRALLPVHLAGWPCDMPGIMALAEAHGLAVIEDCAQAHGAWIGNRAVGSFGDLAAFSFCQDKIMTTGGEGGILLTDNDALWRRAWSYKDHGKSYDTVHRTDHPPGFRWLHESFGSNWRLTEMQAAIGLCQLAKLDPWIATRRAHSDIYRAAFDGLAALRTPAPDASLRHAYYKFYTFVRPQALKSGWDRDRILAETMAQDVPCFSGSCPEIYRERAIIDAGLSPDKPLKTAQTLGETSLMFVVHPTLSADQVATIADVAASVVRRAQR